MHRLLAFLIVAAFAHAEKIGPWDMTALRQPPKAEWGATDGLVQEVVYEGEPLGGKPTRIFAYLGRPAESKGYKPAIVLVHGGGGQAFKDWAAHWAKRGYIALAMDTAGQGKDKARLPDGGPDQEDSTKFRTFTDAEAREMWTYHAVAAVVRGTSLLESITEVDRARIAITGISWGGYLTCIVAGLDERLKVAVPVYGCGFLGDDSAWKVGYFDKMPAGQRARWLRFFDPSSYLGGARCPVLFLNGTNDFAYPLGSYRKTYSLVRPDLRHLAVKLELKHGHYWDLGEVDAFVDDKLRVGPPVPRLGRAGLNGSTMLARYQQPAEIAKAELFFTTDTGPWQKRKWQTAPATATDGVLSGAVPDVRPVACYLAVTDSRGTQVTTEHFEFSAMNNASTPDADAPRIVEEIVRATAAGIIIDRMKLGGAPAKHAEAVDAWLRKHQPAMQITTGSTQGVPAWGWITQGEAGMERRRFFLHVFRPPASGEIVFDVPAAKVKACDVVGALDRKLPYRADGDARIIIPLPADRDPIATVLRVDLEW